MSTFDIFTQLPLFKDIEKESLFSLVPKISLDFEQFKEGEGIFLRHSSVNGLIYLLHGQARLQNDSGEKLISGPALLSWTGIFGQVRTHRSEAKTLTACSTLTVDKRSLIFLIRSEPVFMEAYLDLLSDSMFSIHSPL
ncbi:MAG TPA: hypothetical protein VFP20_11765 [Bacteroidales bacterium]|nr:hypothetical protein [Bacteroidales bacterium]